MNRFDDAVLDLLSSAPRATTMERLRARIHRRRKRRQIAIAAVAIVIVGSAGVAAALDRRSAGTDVTVSPTTPSDGAGVLTTTTSTIAPPPSVATDTPRLGVSVVLGTQRLVSGMREPATLVIRNDTGAPIRSTACQLPGESVLGQVGLSSQPPTPPPTTTSSVPAATEPLVHAGGPCLGPEHDMVGIGTTRVPFVLEASSSLCQLAPAAQLQVHECLPGGQPLPPGRYYVRFDWYGGNLPNPTIPVEVLAPSS